MSMKKWTQEELISTRDKLEELIANQKKSNNAMWHLTAFLGAFAVSTGIVFIFFDGVDVLNIFLIILGSITCLAWYKSEKQRKDNRNFLSEIQRELKKREKRGAEKAKTKNTAAPTAKTQTDTQSDKQADTPAQTASNDSNAAAQETNNAK